MSRGRVFLDVRTHVVDAQQMYLANGFVPTGVEIQDGGFTEIQLARDC